MIKIFVDKDEEKLEKKMNKWVSENKMEVSKISLSVKKDRVGCAIICTPIDYNF